MQACWTKTKRQKDRRGQAGGGWAGLALFRFGYMGHGLGRLPTLHTALPFSCHPLAVCPCPNSPTAALPAPTTSPLSPGTLHALPLCLAPTPSPLPHSYHFHPTSHLQQHCLPAFLCEICLCVTSPFCFPSLAMTCIMCMV